MLKVFNNLISFFSPSNVLTILVCEKFSNEVAIGTKMTRRLTVRT